MVRFAWVALIVLVLVAPTASAAANGVHLSYAGDRGYFVTFSSPTPLSDPRVTWPGGSAVAKAWQHPTADNDSLYVATIPLPSGGGLDYTVEGRTFHAQAAPAPGVPMRVAFVADWGRSDDSWRVLDAIVAAKPDLVIVGGDVSYANGVPGKWDQWFARVEPLASRVPIMTAYGNHESLCSQPDGTLYLCAHEADEYAEHFHMTNGDAHEYTFDWGSARFLALDTEAYHKDPEKPLPFETDSGAQIDFAKRALADAPPTSAWKIAYYHRSLYSSNTGQDEPDAQARAAFEPVFQAGGVDLALSGHVHAYERSHAIGGVVYVDSGGGGRSLYTEWGPAPSWSAKRSAEFEFVLLDISPQKIDVRALRPDGSTLDAFTITKNGVQETSGGKLVPAAPLVVAAAVALVLARRRAPSLRLARRERP